LINDESALFFKKNGFAPALLAQQVPKTFIEAMQIIYGFRRDVARS